MKARDLRPAKRVVSRGAGKDDLSLQGRPQVSPSSLDVGHVAHPRLGAPGLEGFDWVAYGGVEIGNDNLEPIPPSRLGDATGFARATCAGLVEKQS